jgi:hypothetical protein
LTMSNNTKLAKSYATPWTLRAYDALPGSPLRIGIGFTIGLLLVFFVGRSLVGSADDSTPDDLRIALTQLLMTSYSASAYAYLLMTARKTTHDLSPVAGHITRWQTIVDRAGKHPWWILPLVGASSFLVLGVAVTNLTTPEPVNPWDWHGWNYDVFWHRATTVVFVWWLACLCYVTVVESVRLSRLSGHIESLDLLELRPYQALVRQGHVAPGRRIAILAGIGGVLDRVHRVSMGRNDVAIERHSQKNQSGQGQGTRLVQADPEDRER